MRWATANADVICWMLAIVVAAVLLFAVWAILRAAGDLPTDGAPDASEIYLGVESAGLALARAKGARKPDVGGPAVAQPTPRLQPWQDWADTFPRYSDGHDGPGGAVTKEGGR